MKPAQMRHLSAILSKTALSLGLFVSGGAHALDVKYLESPAQYLAAAYSAISQATTEVVMTYYEFNPCSSSTTVLIKALEELKIAKPQVKIMVVADAYPFAQDALAPSMKAGALARYLKKKNIDFMLYNPPDLGADPGHRSHAKYIVVDGQLPTGILITGSSNMADEYFSMRNGGLNYINRDVMVTGGEMPSEARQYFKEMWNSGGARSAIAVDNDTYTSYVSSCFAMGKGSEILLNELKLSATATVAAAASYACPNGKFYADSYNLTQKPTTNLIYNFLSDRKNQKLFIENYIYDPKGTLADIMTQSREKVPTLVYTNYFVDSGEVFEVAHNRAIQRDTGHKMRILSLPSMDYSSQHWDRAANRMFFQDHSKIYVSNGQNIIVSSFNMDNRSANINAESAAVFYNCPDLALHASQATAALVTQLTPQQQKAIQLRAAGQGISINADLFTEIRDLFGGDLY